MRSVPPLLYLAYGSNLHPRRLAERVPSARFVDVVTLPGFTLAFHKRGQDGSGKCLLCASPDGLAWGALYEIDAAHKSILDRFEGLGHGYVEATLPVTTRGTVAHPFVYMAQDGYVDASLLPYDWYRDIVIAGARHHDFPADYLGALAAVRTQPDADVARATLHARLLASMSPHALRDLQIRDT